MGTDICVNRKALHDYFILDRFEAGLKTQWFDRRVTVNSIDR